jgi:hypothetical protein
MFFDNLIHKPDFAYNNEPNNVHLAANSFCIDKGNNSVVGIDEVDIDGDTRILDGDNNPAAIVDIGADEVACTNVYHPLDWNADGVVNLEDAAVMVRQWMIRGCAAPLWCEGADLTRDGRVGIEDLAVMAEEWMK